MCSKRQRRVWRLLRALVFLAAVSLVLYIPYKYVTQPQAMVGIYGLLFPLSSLVAASGLLLAIRPGWVFHLPLWLRTAIATIAAGWVATGVLCIPTLTNTVIAAPFKGLFAAFHMTAQHIFLSFAVIFGLLATQWVYSLFDLPLPEESSRPTAEKASERT